jgi:hypothetical protein
VKQKDHPSLHSSGGVFKYWHTFSFASIIIDFDTKEKAEIKTFENKENLLCKSIVEVNLIFVFNLFNQKLQLSNLGFK